MRKKTLTLVGILVLAVGSFASAATFDWNNSAADKDWYNPANWTVTGGSTTFPTEGGTWGYATNSDVGTVNISDGSLVETGIGGSVHTSPGTTSDAVLNITNGSTFHVLGSMWCGDTPGGNIFDLNVIDSTLTVDGSNFDMSNESSTVFTGHFTNSMVSATGGTARVARYTGATGTLYVTNTTFSTSGHIVVGEDGGTHGELYLVDSDVTVGDGGADNLYQNDDPGTNQYSLVEMTGGTLDISNNHYCNDDAGTGSEAYFILNSGTVTVGGGSGLTTVPWNISCAKAHMTIHDGSYTTGEFNFGRDTSTDNCECRLFMNGCGVFQCENIVFTASDSKIVFVTGTLRVNNANVSEADMQNLIDTGMIEAGGGYQIYTDGNYTVLGRVPVTHIMVNPMDLEVTEGGATNSYEVYFTAQPDPSYEVTVTATPGDAQIDIGNGIGAAKTLTFTSVNWETAQTITVAAFDDEILERQDDPHTTIITHTSYSEDEEFNGLTINSVEVLVHDNELTCGDWGYYQTDLNEDCYVNLRDYAMFAMAWLKSNE